MKKIIFILCIVVTVIACKKDKTTASNLDCPTTVSFASSILPVFQSKCLPCHGVGGVSPQLTDHTSISTAVSNSLNRMKTTGGALMPQGGPALADSIITKIECWVQQGKANN